jgi:nucleoside-diphosphate-sugar epimerase
MIVLAGATGDLGGRIAGALRDRDAAVTALVRPGTAPERLATLTARGVTVVEADSRDIGAMAAACKGAACIVSALSGLRDTIVSGQGRLLDAALRAGVTRFVPSDFAADFTKVAPGSNRNFDLRREFHDRLDATAIRPTSILNGAFAEMLTGPAPIIIKPLRRVLFWSDPDQELDFTTMDDTARFTAAAVLDDSAPRVLRIAGDQVTARGLVGIMAGITGQPWRLMRGGSIGRLGTIIKLARFVAPGRGELYPPWQGMQYLHNMFSGQAKLSPLDNERYPMRWTGVREVLAAAGK